MRQYIDLIEGIVKSVMVLQNREPVSYLLNPTEALVRKWMGTDKIIKGFINGRGDLYVWDAYDAHHTSMARALGTGMRYEFVVGPSEKVIDRECENPGSTETSKSLFVQTSEESDQLNANRNFVRAFGTMPETIYEEAMAPKWTLAQAEELVRDILAACPGFTIKIVGSVEYRGYSNKDVDLSLEMVDLDGDHDEVARYLRSIGATLQGRIVKMQFECWHLVDGRRVDLFYELPRINPRFKRR